MEIMDSIHPMGIKEWNILMVCFLFFYFAMPTNLLFAFVNNFLYFVLSFCCVQHFQGHSTISILVWQLRRPVSLRRWILPNSNNWVNIFTFIKLWCCGDCILAYFTSPFFAGFNNQYHNTAAMAALMQQQHPVSISFKKYLFQPSYS
jgi:hypothetical protein